MAKPNGTLLFTIPFSEKFLHIKEEFAESGPVPPKLLMNKNVHTMEKQSPTKYTKPLICPVIIEPMVMYPTIKNGANLKNKYNNDARFILSILLDIQIVYKIFVALYIKRKRC
uniref:Uncharacterized protein n=1 Tax=viral metagenome TaxID=1070528 RepID=A0A6C0HIT3_9ZZZZ